MASRSAGVEGGWMAGGRRGKAKGTDRPGVTVAPYGTWGRSEMGSTQPPGRRRRRFHSRSAAPSRSPASLTSKYDLPSARETDRISWAPVASVLPSCPATPKRAKSGAQRCVRFGSSRSNSSVGTAACRSMTPWATNNVRIARAEPLAKTSRLGSYTRTRRKTGAKRLSKALADASPSSMPTRAE